jgi:hypothetical protein
MFVRVHWSYPGNPFDLDLALRSTIDRDYCKPSNMHLLVEALYP